MCVCELYHYIQCVVQATTSPLFLPFFFHITEYDQAWHSTPHSLVGHIIIIVTTLLCYCIDAAVDSIPSISGPYILDVDFNGTSQDLQLQWEPQLNVSMYNIQLFTCNSTMLVETPVNATCSSSQLSGVSFTEYDLLLLSVQKCVMSVCGGSEDAHVVAVNRTNAGMYIGTAIWYL